MADRQYIPTCLANVQVEDFVLLEFVEDNSSIDDLDNRQQDGASAVVANGSMIDEQAREGAHRCEDGIEPLEESRDQTGEDVDSESIFKSPWRKARTCFQVY